MPFAERARHRLHYDVVGPDGAPAVLLVMGTSFSSRAWDELPARLADRYRVVTFDNRGAGRSTRSPGFFRMADLADDARAVLDAADIAQAHVFGVSLGGMIALELALRHPARVTSLALGCTFSGYRRSAKASLAVRARLIASGLLGRVKPHHVAGFLIADDCYAGDPHRFGAWLARVEPSDPGTVLRQLYAITRHEADDRLAGLRVPTVILTGDADRLVPAANSAALARRIPGATLVELAGAGHCFPFEQLEQTLDALERAWTPAAVTRAANG